MGARPTHKGSSVVVRVKRLIVPYFHKIQISNFVIFRYFFSDILPILNSSKKFVSIFHDIMYIWIRYIMVKSSKKIVSSTKESNK